jgi:hypothetical protein
VLLWNGQSVLALADAAGIMYSSLEDASMNASRFLSGAVINVTFEALKKGTDYDGVIGLKDHWRKEIASCVLTAQQAYAASLLVPAPQRRTKSVPNLSPIDKFIATLVLAPNVTTAQIKAQWNTFNKKNDQDITKDATKAKFLKVLANLIVTPTVVPQTTN